MIASLIAAFAPEIQQYSGSCLCILVPVARWDLDCFGTSLPRLAAQFLRASYRLCTQHLYVSHRWIFVEHFLSISSILSQIHYLADSKCQQIESQSLAVTQTNMQMT